MEISIEEKNEELAIEETIKPIAESESVIKEFFLKEDGGYVKDLAPLFGQSETELTKEFGIYKAKKIYNKLNYLLIDQSLLNAVILKELNLAVKCNFNSVAVFPTNLALAKSALAKSGVKLRALISYPHGEESVKVAKFSVKSAVQQGANELQVFMPSSIIKNGDLKGLVKMVKRLKKAAGKSDIIITLDTSVLTLPELESAVKAIAKGVRVYAVSLAASGKDKKVDISLIKEVVLAADGRVLVECFSPIGVAEDAVSMLLNGASLITTENCELIVSDLSAKIERASGEKAQSLDK